jgi:acyl-CoA synthetase (AMP-forming)/AMP-acid ligase II
VTPIEPRRASIVHALLANAERGSDAPRTVFALAPDEHIELRHDVFTQEALRAAGILAEAGVREGDRIVLCLPTSPEFITAFFGAVLLGAAPVAIALPSRFGSLGGFVTRYRNFEGYLRPRALIASPPVTEALAGLTGGDVAVLDGVALRAAAVHGGSAKAPVLPRSDALGFLQLTSGSTGDPMGVMISHGNVAANCEQLARTCAWGASDIQVAWLPLNHDMGLIGTLLAPIFLGTDSVLLPPDRFLRSPAEWLRTVSRYRGSLSAAPNFAFGYAAARVKDAELDGVDLSSWRFVFCGAEPICPQTLQHFVERFAGWGMRPDALVPCYGLAEATLGVTVASANAPVRYDTISRNALASLGRVVQVPATDPLAQRVVDCGPPVEGTEVRIVDDNGNAVPHGSLGRIQFRGPSRTAGYHQRPDATRIAIGADGWWNTGDLGYLRDGGLRVVGRAKEVIIIRGANYFPADFERATETVEGVRTGGVVAVGVYDESVGTEALHLIVETEEDSSRHAQLRRAIVAAVSQRSGIAPAGVHLLPRRSLPKTSSGKPRRLETRRLLLQSNRSHDGAKNG